MDAKIPENVQNLLAELKDGLTHMYHDRFKGLYLFGSYATGEADSESDVDVMIVLNTYESYGKEIDKTGELISALSLKYGISISRVIIKELQWQKSETPLLQNIRTDGVLA
jgi:predicted nucleotidyltransferase